MPAGRAIGPNQSEHRPVLPGPPRTMQHARPWIAPAALAALLVVCPTACRKQTPPPTADANAASPETEQPADTANAKPANANAATAPAQPPSARSPQPALADIIEEARIIGGYTPDHVSRLKTLLQDRRDDPTVRRVAAEAFKANEDHVALIALRKHDLEKRDTPATRQALTEALIDARRFHEALNVITPLASRDDADLDSVWLAIRAAFLAGREPEADAWLEKYADRLIAAGQLEVLYVRAMIRFHEDRLDDAATDLQRLLAAAPRHLPANLAAARLFAARGNADQARDYERIANKVREEYNAARRAALERVNRWHLLNQACNGQDEKACEAALRDAADLFPKEALRRWHRNSTTQPGAP